MNPTAKPRIDYDLIIAGGGMVGSMLAAGLAHSSLKVAVLETGQPKPFKHSQTPDLRVSALSLASEKMLEAVGAWRGISDMRACPFRHMQVWDGEAGGKTAFFSGDVGETHLGHIVENRILQLALLHVLEVHDNIDLLYPEGLQSFNLEENWVEVLLTSGEKIYANLLVGADGANSQVRQQAGIPIDVSSYPQHALVATVETSLPQQAITWQKFLPSGPQAFLPLCGNSGSIVWYHSEEEVQRLIALDDSSFIEALEESFPETLGAILSVKARGSFPLKRSHAKRYVNNRVALIGDAAHTVHPLAGQGVNLGLLDAAVLAEVLINVHAKGQGIGALRHLRAYERWRKTENALMIQVLDGFYHAFKAQPPTVQRLRSVALDVANRFTPLKSVATRYAVGTLGDIPLLAKGILP